MAARTAVVVIALMLALTACGDSNTSSAGTTTLTLHATQTSFDPIFQSKKGFQPGDSFITSSNIDGGGHKEAYCVVSQHKRTDWCAVTLVLPQGQISAEGVFVDAPELSGPIALLSGSKEYEGATGTLTTSGVMDRRETITLQLR